MLFCLSLCESVEVRTHQEPTKSAARASDPKKNPPRPHQDPTKSAESAAEIISEHGRNNLGVVDRRSGGHSPTLRRRSQEDHGAKRMFL